MALLWKMICNLGDPMSLRHPVPQVRRQKTPLSIPRALQKRPPLYFLIPTYTVPHIQNALTTILPTYLIALPYLLTLTHLSIATYLHTLYHTANKTSTPTPSGLCSVRFHSFVDHLPPHHTCDNPIPRPLLFVYCWCCWWKGGRGCRQEWWCLRKGAAGHTDR